MQDVTRIDIMPREALKVALSFNIPDVTSTVVTTSEDEALTDERLYADSLLSLNESGGNDVDAMMNESVTHKVTEKREMGGVIRTHTLQVGIEIGYQAVREHLKKLQDADFHVVLSTCNGERYLAYALPGTSQFTMDEQKGQSVQMNVKATLMSVSGFIKIIDPV